MTKQDLLDFSADHIDKLWTMEDHQRLVVGLRAIMAGQRVQRTAETFHFDVPYPEATRYHHSPVDSEASEI